MNKKIVFFDIDGTLSNEEDGFIPTSTTQAIHHARQNGHICMINTGRPISTIDSSIRNIGFDGYICGCGTYIEYQGQVLFHKELDEKLRKDIIQMSFDCGIDNVLEGKQGAFFPHVSHHEAIEQIKQNYLDAKHPTFTYTRDDDILFDKCAAWYTKDADIERFKAFLTPHFHIIQRAEQFIEIVPLGISKATGIQMIIDHLGMTHDQTISIGDSTNDLPMLTYTKESIAMGNANPVLFDKVTYQTTDLFHDGIYNALKHFKLIQ